MKLLKEMRYVLFSYLIVTLVLSSCRMESCNNEVGISQYEISKTNNRLRFKVNYKLSDSVNSIVRYWKVDENDTISIQESSSEVSDTLYGFKEYSKYIIQVLVGDCVLKQDTLITDPLRIRAMRRMELLKDNGDFKGYIMFSMEVESNRHIYAIINDDAEVVWYHFFPKRPDGFKWTNNNTLLAILSREDIHEIDLKGETLFRLNQGERGLQKSPHHEINKDVHGNMYMLVFDTMHLSSKLSRKYKVANFITDGILVLDDKGNHLWNWKTTDVLMPEVDETMDFGHANALDKVDDGFIVSYKNFNQLWKISNEGRLQWKFGQDGDFAMAPGDQFIGQHAAHYAGKDLVLLDNGADETKITRGMKFELDEDNQSSLLKQDYQLPERLFSFKKGNAIKISDSMMLVNSTLTSTLAVVNNEGEIVWEVMLPGQSYRVEFREDIF